MQGRHHEKHSNSLVFQGITPYSPEDGRPVRCPQCLDIKCYNTYSARVSLKTLRDELKMSKPFKSVEEEALLSIARTAALLEHAGAEALKPFKLTITQ